jgi:hypothetical protein
VEGWRSDSSSRCLPSKCKALSSNPSTEKKKRKEQEALKAMQFILHLGFSLFVFKFCLLKLKMSLTFYLRESPGNLLRQCWVLSIWLPQN